MPTAVPGRSVSASGVVTLAAGDGQFAPFTSWTGFRFVHPAVAVVQPFARAGRLIRIYSARSALEGATAARGVAPGGP